MRVTGLTMGVEIARFEQMNRSVDEVGLRCLVGSLMV